MKKRIIIFALAFLVCYLSTCFVFGTWDLFSLNKHWKALWLILTIAISVLIATFPFED